MLSDNLKTGREIQGEFCFLSVSEHIAGIKDVFRVLFDRCVSLHEKCDNVHCC